MRHTKLTAVALSIAVATLVSPLLAGKMYWRSAILDTTVIDRADLDGDNFETILSCSVDCGFGSLALDTIGQKIYFVEVGGNGTIIARAFLDGSNREDFVVLDGVQSTVADLAVDPVGRNLYWALRGDDGGDTIVRNPLDGSSGAAVLTVTGGIRGLNVDPGVKLYWTEDSPTSRLRRADLNGANLEDLAIDTVDFSDTALDLGSGIVYWLAGDEIRQANLDGSDPSTLPVSLQGPSAIAFDPVSGLLYLTVIPQAPAGRIVIVDPAGTEVTDVLTDLSNPAEIAIHATANDVPAASPPTLAFTVLLVLAASALLLAHGRRLTNVGN
jgi:uncharacterized protein YjbI with pentapeptide repeats